MQNVVKLHSLAEIVNVLRPCRSINGDASHVEQQGVAAIEE